MMGLWKFIKRAVHGVLFRIQCLFEFIFYNLQFKVRSIFFKSKYKKLERFKDKYKGERVFFIGNGSSLTNDDLAKLKDEYTCATNGFVRGIKEIQYEPTIYGFTDGCMVEDEYCKKEIMELRHSFIFYPKRHDLKRAGYKILQAMPNAYEYPMKDTANWIIFFGKTPAGFSSNITEEVFYGFTCVYAMAQVLAYMGFTEIYLLGMDCIYRKGERSYQDMRSVDRIKKGELGGKTVNEFILAWQKVREYTDSKGIQVFNATRGGMLEVFQRVNLDEVLKRETERNGIELNGKK